MGGGPLTTERGTTTLTFEAVATGEPLSVESRTDIVTAQESVVTGHRECFDAQTGQAYVCGTDYANVDVERAVYRWAVKQGASPISALDTLYIAQDPELLAAMERRRSVVEQAHADAPRVYATGMAKANRRKRLGKALAIASAAGFVGGIVLMTAGESTKGAGAGVFFVSTFGLFPLGMLAWASGSTRADAVTRNANGLAMSRVSPSDFRSLTENEEHVRSVVERYNLRMRGPVERISSPPPPPPPRGRDDEAKRRKQERERRR